LLRFRLVMLSCESSDKIETSMAGGSYGDPDDDIE
jgi:hypothetical protein